MTSIPATKVIPGSRAAADLRGAVRLANQIQEFRSAEFKLRLKVLT
jgi:hypothetical protein